MAQDQIFTDKIDNFFGGMPDDPRAQNPAYSRVAQHFDLFTFPKKLVPFRNMEADQNTTYEIVNFEYANSLLYGLGVVSATAKAKVFYKNSDPLTGSWTAASSGEDSAGAREVRAFLHFHNYLYGGAAGTRIWAYGDITGTPSFTSSAYSGAGAPTGQGIITSDDLLLFPCTNKIAKKSGAGSGPTDAWSVGITVPTLYKISDLCEIGDDVALALKPLAGFGSKVYSKVFIWDKYSLDPKAVIDFGEGSLEILEEVAGELVGVLNVGVAAVFGIQPKLVVRRWNGGTKARQVKEIAGDREQILTVYGNNTKVKDGNKFSFGVKIVLDGTTYHQLMTIGSKGEGYPLTIALDRKLNNDTAISSNINGVGKLGDYYFAAFNDNGSVNRTNDTNVFTNCTSTYITDIITGDGRVEGGHRFEKSLLMAGIICEPLTTGQSITLSYRVNGASSWTAIRTYSYGDDTVGMGFEAGVDATALDFENFRELEFKVDSNGGAEITGIVYSWKLATAEVVNP